MRTCWMTRAARTERWTAEQLSACDHTGGATAYRCRNQPVGSSSLSPTGDNERCRNGRRAACTAIAQRASCRRNGASVSSSRGRACRHCAMRSRQTSRSSSLAAMKGEPAGNRSIDAAGAASSGSRPRHFGPPHVARLPSAPPRRFRWHGRRYGNPAGYGRLKPVCGPG